MATHLSILVWKIPWTEEPGALQSIKVTESRIRLKSLQTLSSWKGRLLHSPFLNPITVLEDAQHLA